MAKRDERMKASDVFNTSRPFLGTTTSVSQAFPSIAELHLEVEERGDHGDRRPSTAIYTLRTLPGEYIDCRNPRCYNGGCRIGQVIRGMCYSGQTELETTVNCQGYEGSPMGRKNYGPCWQSFALKIRIKYKEDGNL